MNQSTTTATTKKTNTKAIAMIALMAAITCILGPLSLPIGPVPISLTNFAIYITVYILGWKKGTISYLIYMLIGTIGIPVFSGFSGGLAKVTGPTGGYLVGFILIAIISGFIIEHFNKSTPLHTAACIAGMVVSTAICYVLGTLWFVHIFSGSDTPYSFLGACAVCVFPFIPGDLIKIVVASIIGPQIKKALVHANLC